jgi:hypothetical protein
MYYYIASLYTKTLSRLALQNNHEWINWDENINPIKSRCLSYHVFSPKGFSLRYQKESVDREVGSYATYHNSWPFTLDLAMRRMILLEIEKSIILLKLMVISSNL